MASSSAITGPNEASPSVNTAQNMAPTTGGNLDPNNGDEGFPDDFIPSDDDEADEKDKAERDKLLREGAQAVKERQALTPPPFAITLYNKESTINAFSYLWKKPTRKTKAYEHLVTINQAIRKKLMAEAEVNNPATQEKPAPKGSWHAEELVFPIDEFVENAVANQEVVQSIQASFNNAPRTEVQANHYITESFPMLVVKFASRRMPIHKYVNGWEVLPHITKDQLRKIYSVVDQYFRENGINQISPEDSKLFYDHDDNHQPFQDPPSQQPQPPMFDGGQQPPQPPMFDGGQQPPQPPMFNGGQQPPQPPMFDGGQQPPQPPMFDGGQQPPQPPMFAPFIPTKQKGYSIEINNDGRTFLGKVEHVIEVGRGARVIVNEGTHEKPYYSVHPGKVFGTGVTRNWINNGTFNSHFDISKLERQDLKSVLNYVDVKTTREYKRDQRPIRIYKVELGSVEGKMFDAGEIWLTRRHFLRLWGQGIETLESIHSRCREEQDTFRKYLAQCKQNRRYPDTWQPLTDSEVSQMPWLGNQLKSEEDEEL